MCVGKFIIWITRVHFCQQFDCCGSKIGAKDYDRYDSVPKSCIAENYDKVFVATIVVKYSLP